MVEFRKFYSKERGFEEKLKEEEKHPVKQNTADKPRTKEETIISEKNQEMKRIRVLVIDNDFTNRHRFRLWLEREYGKNFEMREALTASEAIGIVKNEDFDAVFIESTLPDMECLSAIGKIRETLNEKRSNDIPIVMLNELLRYSNNEIERYREIERPTAIIRKSYSGSDAETIKRILEKKG